MMNPLYDVHRLREDVVFRSYGPSHQEPPEEGPSGQAAGPGGGCELQIVDTFGPYEAEYASIRKAVGIMDQPQAGLIEVSGADRLDFLQRMLTHDMAGLLPGQSRRTFLLNKTGRIDADLWVLHEQDRTWLLTDIFRTAPITRELEKYLFTEDVEVRDTSELLMQLTLTGPMVATLVRRACGSIVADLQPSDHCRVTFADQTCPCLRRDETGSPGLHLLIQRDHAQRVYKALFQAAEDEGSQDPGSQLQCRPIGWQAYNTARIEAGSPLYNVDFGPDCLPHETGIVDEAVSFTKGCYLGQEIVARMQSLGHPKRVLVGLKFADDRLPIAGSEVFEPIDGHDRPGDVVGAITSSTVSPMLGGTAIAFAMVKWARHTLGTRLLCAAEGSITTATVSELAFLK